MTDMLVFVWKEAHSKLSTIRVKWAIALYFIQMIFVNIRWNNDVIFKCLDNFALHNDNLPSWRYGRCNRRCRKFDLENSISVRWHCHGLWKEGCSPWKCWLSEKKTALEDDRHAWVHIRIVYIDETGFSSWTKRTDGRLWKGEIRNRIVGRLLRRNVTVVAAASYQVDLECRAIPWTSVSKERFNSYKALL